MNGATTDTTTAEVPAEPPPRRKKKLRYNPNRVAHSLDKLGLGYFSPMARLLGRDEPAKQVREIATNTTLPLLAFAAFVVVWAWCSSFVVSGSVKIPSPAETWVAWAGSSSATPQENAKSIIGFAGAEKAAEEKFYIDREVRVESFRKKARAAEADGNAELAKRMNATAEKFASKKYQGNKTFFDQIGISLLTVAIGFLASFSSADLRHIFRQARQKRKRQTALPNGRGCAANEVGIQGEVGGFRTWF